MSSQTNFIQSANCFVHLLKSVPAEGWDHAASHGWTVRELAGHTVRAILTVETYLSHDEPDRALIPDAEHYYSIVYPTLFDPQQMRRDAESAGEWLSMDPAALAADALARTSSLIAAQPLGRVVSIGGMGITLTEYLRTRVLELVLHTAELADATGIPHRLPDAATRDSASLAESIPAAVRHGENRLVGAIGVG